MLGFACADSKPLPGARQVHQERRIGLQVSIARVWRASALLLLYAGVSTRAANAEPCSLAGGSAWREFRTAHFVIDVAGWDRDRKSVV